jgi:hypothetical protein
MDGQSDAPKPLRQHRHDPPRIVFPFEADHEIVGKPKQKALPFHPGLDVALVPFIQHMVKEDVVSVCS